MTKTNSGQWGIGDVARRTGVTERTLRYCEELGLLAPATTAAASIGSTGFGCCANWVRRWPVSYPEPGGGALAGSPTICGDGGSHPTGQSGVEVTAMLDRALRAAGHVSDEERSPVTRRTAAVAAGG